MGGFLAKEPETKMAKSTVKFLRSIALVNIFECYEYYVKRYDPNNELTRDEFDDVFSPILNDTEVYFNKLVQDDKADFFEALAAMTMFSKGEFNTKINSLYQIYDADGSGEIDRDELKTFLRSGILGLCKLLCIPIPYENEIQTFAYSCFRQMDADGGGSIDYDEFEYWIRNSDEIQDFLLKYTGQQTMDRAKKRYTQLLKSYKDAFEEVSIEFMGEHYATVKSLKAALKKILPKHESRHLEELFVLLDHENKGAVSEEDFDAIMKPWASFSATDINGDGELDITELKCLIWLMNDDEPAEYRVQRDMKAIDADNSGYVDRMEWIEYLASPDPETGKTTFNFKLKRAFDTHDRDKDGFIDVEDLFGLLKDTLQELTKGKGTSTKMVIEKLTKALAIDIMNTLDTRDGKLDWPAFKKYMWYAKEKEENLKKFVEYHS